MVSDSQAVQSYRAIILDLIRFGYERCDFELAIDRPDGVEIRHRARGGEYRHIVANISQRELLNLYQQYMGHV